MSSRLADFRWSKSLDHRGSFQVDADRVGQVGGIHQRLFQPGPGQVGLAKAGAVQIGLAQVGLAQGGAVEPGALEIGFFQISAAQVYSAGTGLTLTGTQFSLTTPVAGNLGGTGLSSYTAGDLLYASNTTTLSKLALGTQGYVLKAGASGPEWGGISGGTF